ncbi:hypothetical protein PZ01_10410, partial [Lacticaseibacillus rhamnosus]
RSTGFAAGGATVHDVKLMRQTVGDQLGVNIVASGGVHTLADLTALQTAGIQAAVIGKAWQTGSFPLNKLKELEDNDADKTHYSMP